VREEPDGPVDSVLVLTTLGAPERRRLRGRRGRLVSEARPEPVPTARVTVVRGDPFPSRAGAEEWLAALHADPDLATSEQSRALLVLNRALRAYRAAAGDPHAGDVSGDRALVTRIGFGRGEAVAEGRYAQAWELPGGAPGRVRRSMAAPEQRFAAILGAHERALVCEELVLRASADAENGRFREAALQIRVALEAMLAELAGDEGQAARLEELSAHRATAGEAANAALRGPLGEELRERTAQLLARMEDVLRRRRLGG
jgi:hypothetical protein